MSSLLKALWAWKLRQRRWFVFVHCRCSETCRWGNVLEGACLPNWDDLSPLKTSTTSSNKSTFIQQLKFDTLQTLFVFELSFLSDSLNLAQHNHLNLFQRARFSSAHQQIYTRNGCAGPEQEPKNLISLRMSHSRKRARDGESLCGHCFS